MNPAERFHALKALQHGVNAAVKAAQHEAEAYAASTRAKTLETDYGQVTVVRRRPTVTFDEAGLVAWARKNAPTEIVETVRPAYADALRKTLLVDGEDVVTAAGEVLDFASASEVTTYLKADLNTADKGMIEAYVRDSIDRLLPPEVGS